MAAVLKHWREAASLILVTSNSARVGTQMTQLNLTAAYDSAAKRFNNGSSKNDEINIQSDAGENFEVLMLKRSSKSKFMPNVYIFPGGVAVDSDFSSKWLSVFNKMGSDICKKMFEAMSSKSCQAAPMFTRQRDSAFTSIPSEVAFRICAIRETFEESGVLLVQPAKQLSYRPDSIYKSNGSLSTGLIHENVTLLSDWRDRVNRDPNEFLLMCQELDLIPEVWSLFEWSNFLTPPRDMMSSYRFDTIFYVCCMDHKPRASHDFGETVNTIWGSPSSILSAYFRQKSGLAPPQLYELARLMNFTSTSDLLDILSQPERDRVERWCPLTVACQDGVLFVMPGDDLYPDQADLMSKKEYKFDESIEALNRKFPKHHRMFYKDHATMGCVDFNATIKPRKGHVVPRIDLLNKLKTSSNL
ncbi:nucleoside diphosphate-linked moiety X motif 19 mitochondrial [Biomphalaria pfeifferi]|uniref:Nucleoside diphosphate-linked moiety X motif 19 mitochondrial n=1 Tax=Biomphalaria pfeifferi TaxID=112525 RepID=A0AAD8AVV2_BIOPF|nr:nucleoside diphosphate-linked moiety X motif 19 mitochondrial [Biomphalaria pfeifferi]